MSAAPILTPISFDPDAQLMTRVRAGDMAAFETLVRRHRAALIQFLFGMVRDRAVAEELSQDTFLRLYLTRERYEPTGRFTSWLYLIARHLGLNWVRDHARERNVEYIDAHRPGKPAWELSDQRFDVAESLHRNARCEGIRRALRQLPERQRTVIMMSKYAGHDCVEIAKKMQCSHQAVRSLMFRAYANLRETLDPEAL